MRVPNHWQLYKKRKIKNYGVTRLLERYKFIFLHHTNSQFSYILDSAEIDTFHTITDTSLNQEGIVSIIHSKGERFKKIIHSRGERFKKIIHSRKDRLKKIIHSRKERLKKLLYERSKLEIGSSSGYES